MLVTILLTVIVFSLLVYIHELGHYLSAKRAGIRVEEFGFGIPPRLLTLGKRGDVLITLNLIPIGGFVRLAGMPGGLDEDDPDGFSRKSIGARTLAITSGTLMNILLTILLFAAVSVMGEPVDVERLVIAAVVESSPAHDARLQVGDVIVGLDGQEVRNFFELYQHTLSKAGESVLVTVDRSGSEFETRLVPRQNPPPEQGAMGIAVDRTFLRTDLVKYPLWRALPRGVVMTGETVADLWLGLKETVKSWLRPGVASSMPVTGVGVVGIGQIVGQVAQSGDPWVARRMILLTAFLSINFAIFNLLPIPALDGGRLVFIILEWLRRGKRIDPRKEGYVHMVGMVVLIGLVVVVAYRDIARLAGS